jgi:3-methyladenine DNA glycosylase AlkD
LWASGYHEARLLASMVDEPGLVDEEQLEQWVAELTGWDLCDQCCSNLFRHTPAAPTKAVAWSGRAEPFVKRAGFVLMAQAAVHDKRADDDRLLAWLPIIQREAADGRNEVKKAISWALRQIGKRTLGLNAAAIAAAQALRRAEAPAARWVGQDALRELTSPAVQLRLQQRAAALAARTAGPSQRSATASQRAAAASGRAGARPPARRARRPGRECAAE